MPPPVEMAGQGVVDRWYKLVGRCEEIMLVTRDIETDIAKTRRSSEPQSVDNFQYLHDAAEETNRKRATLAEMNRKMKTTFADKRIFLSSLQLEDGLNQHITDFRETSSDFLELTKDYATAEERRNQLTDSQPGDPDHLLSLPGPETEIPRQKMLSVLADLPQKDKDVGAFTALQVYKCASQWWEKVRDADLRTAHAQDQTVTVKASNKQLEDQRTELSERLEASKAQVLELRMQSQEALVTLQEVHRHHVDGLQKVFDLKVKNKVERDIQKAIEVKQAGWEETMKTMVSAELLSSKEKEVFELITKLTDTTRQLEDAKVTLQDLEAQTTSYSSQAANEGDLADQKRLTKEVIAEKRTLEDDLRTVNVKLNDVKGRLDVAALENVQHTQELAEVREDLRISRAHATDLEEKQFAALQTARDRANLDAAGEVPTWSDPESMNSFKTISYLASPDRMAYDGDVLRATRIQAIERAFHDDDVQPPNNIVRMPLDWNMSMVDTSSSDPYTEAKSLPRLVDHVWWQTCKRTVDWQAVYLNIERIMLVSAGQQRIQPGNRMSSMLAQASTNLTESLPESSGPSGFFACITAMRAIECELRHVLYVDASRVRRLHGKISEHVATLPPNELVQAMVDWMRSVLDMEGGPTPTQRLLAPGAGPRLTERVASGHPAQMLQCGLVFVVLQPESTTMLVYSSNEVEHTAGMEPSFMLAGRRTAAHSVFGKFRYEFVAAADKWIEDHFEPTKSARIPDLQRAITGSRGGKAPQREGGTRG